MNIRADRTTVLVLCFSRAVLRECAARALAPEARLAARHQSTEGLHEERLALGRAAPVRAARDVRRAVGHHWCLFVLTRLVHITYAEYQIRVLVHLCVCRFALDLEHPAAHVERRHVPHAAPAGALGGGARALSGARRELPGTGTRRRARCAQRAGRVASRPLGVPFARHRFSERCAAPSAHSRSLSLFSRARPADLLFRLLSLLLLAYFHLQYTLNTSLLQYNI